MSDIALYVHWPFCASKCPYCDFNSHVRDVVDYQVWQDSYLQELAYFKDLWQNRQIISIFFGGGTPSLMPPAIAASIIDQVSPYCAPGVEITLEANPGSVEVNKFQDFRVAGINRVSIGVQSLNDDDLKFLGRKHSKQQALKAIEVARQVFPRYSFDLIYARPNQTLTSWEKELKEALTLSTGHLSLYQLTIEKGTEFYRSYLNQDFCLPNQDLSADLYHLTQDIMEDAGLPAYEISNHAALGQECKHNMVYWQYQDYLGIGPGAHSRVKDQAITMIYNPEGWLKAVSERQAGIMNELTLNQAEIFQEYLIMGLRITTGINRAGFAAKFGRDLTSMVPEKTLQSLIDGGFIEVSHENIYATKAGRLVLNQIIERLTEIKLTS